jgi:hypothetical protein
MNCGMGGCGGYGWHGRGFGWIVLKIIVCIVFLGIVFSFGVLVGEFKMVVGDGFSGRSMMRSYRGSPVGTYQMMGGGYAVPATTSTPLK